MEEMIKVMDEHNQIKKELKEETEQKTDESSVESVLKIRQILADKEFTYANFQPIFL